MERKVQDLSMYTQETDFRGRSAFVVQLWWLVWFFLFRPSPQFMYGWRRFLLRLFGAQIGERVLIRPSCNITYPWKLFIGDFSWIGDDVVLYSLGNIRVGKNVVISQRSYLCTGSHDYRSVAFDIYAKEINIEAESWIATDVFIAPGITIGQGAVVGARSSVYENMPAYMICLGNPAKPVKPRI